MRWSSPRSPPASSTSRGSTPSPPTRCATPPSCSTATSRPWWRRGWTPSSTPACPTTTTRASGDNHYNCPVVAYYPELLAANVPQPSSRSASSTPMWACGGTRTLRKRIAQLMHEQFRTSPKGRSAAAAKAAYEAYEALRAATCAETGAADTSTTPGRTGHDHHRGCGRPYHMDPEINHGINDLITSFGFVLVTEDALSSSGWLRAPEGAQPVDLPQPGCTTPPGMCAPSRTCELVQLVSFGCGIDAITTDEVRAILEERRQAVHPAEDRRNQQPGRGQDPHPLPDGGHGRARSE